MENLLKVDKNPVSVHYTDQPVENSAITFLPILEDQSADSISRYVKKPEIRERLQKQIETGFFQGKPGQILDMSADGIVLGGLGKKVSFHPDRVASLLMKFGNQLRENKNKKWLISISAELLEATDSYSALHGSPELDPFLVRKTVAKKSAAAKKSRNSEPEKEANPDYTGSYDAQHLISQIVNSLLIGYVPVSVLKKKNEKSKNRTHEVLIHARGVDKNLVTAAIKRGADIGRMQNAARKVESLPGNYFHPALFEQYTKELAREFSLKIKVFTAAQLEKMGCGGIITVGKGSSIPPRMIVIDYQPTGNRTNEHLVLVGKGITFDTGGISLKPPGDMHEMKYDMCGAGLVVHALALAKLRKVPFKVTGLVGLAENMPGPDAVKPGDVYTAYNGTTVEVQNTDAEGRLVLGDVLSYVSKHYSPTVLFDFATLTGACVIALGHEATGVMTASNSLATKIEEASRSSGDRSWRLPHWSAYDDGLKSEIADVRNIAGRPAGTVTAMRFLSKFVDPSIPWAHFDIAGTAWRSSATRAEPKGATGWGVRFLNEFMESISVK